MNKITRFAFAIIICVVLFSCSGKTSSPKITIKGIRENPQIFVSKEVKIMGMVTNSIDVPLVSYDFYKINDGTGEMWVQTSTGAPNKDSQINLTGVVFQLSAELDYLRMTGLAIKQVRFSIR